MRHGIVCGILDSKQHVLTVKSGGMELGTALAADRGKLPSLFSTQWYSYELA